MLVYIQNLLEISDLTWPWIFSKRLKIERAGDVLADAPAKVAQAILLFCKGQGLLTSVVMPGVDRQRAFSTSSGGSNNGGEQRRLSRGYFYFILFLS